MNIGRKEHSDGAPSLNWENVGIIGHGNGYYFDSFFYCKRSLSALRTQLTNFVDLIIIIKC